MNKKGEHAWLTFVATDETILSALVLAESLRRSRTGNRIGVITNANVSKKGRQILRSGFDDLFLMDDSFAPGWRDKNYGTETAAKTFAHTLQVFDKCVFLGVHSMILENIDGLFQGQPGSCENFPDPIILQPSREVFEYLVQRVNGYTVSALSEPAVFRRCMAEWVQNNQAQNQSSLNMNNLELCVVQFSVANCQLQCTSTHFTGFPNLVQFINVPSSTDEIVARLMDYRSNGRSLLAENRVIETWLEIYETRVRGLLNNFNIVEHIQQKLISKEKIGLESYKNEPIAIIGMSCRFPGAKNLEEFWDLLHSGKDAIGEPPSFRWTKKHSMIGGVSKERKTYAGFLSVPLDEFDARFFDISPKEASLLDPQARLLHEVFWESLEDSGIDPFSLRGSSTGVFTGNWMVDYRDIVTASGEGDFLRNYTGNGSGATAARLSFLLGLIGPNIATESGCSSSIVAMHMAVKSLRDGDSNLALVGSSNALIHPFPNDLAEYVIAPDGRCKAFDANANGFGRGEGCGVVVLKRLSDALRDRDRIWAMIRGSAISQEGLSRSFGTPTVDCEALAMELALSDASVRPEQVSFVETHGTGTIVGDPLEAAAIAKTYHSNFRKEPLIIGSVKTNVGHTESCSGITGIIKTVLALHNEIIPKHLNFHKLNPEINLEMIPAVIPVEPIPWPKVKGCPRIAGVSSFGITGTDGHVVIQEAPDYEMPRFQLALERPVHLIKFSGKTSAALDEILKNYKNFFEMSPEENLADAAYTANTGRASFNPRAFIIASNNKEAAHVISTNKVDRAEQGNDKPGNICFLFTGQGSQYPGMAKCLYDTSPVFRIHFDFCDKFLQERHNLSIRPVLWHSAGNANELDRTMYSQISIFCVEYCLLKLWNSWGIHPDCVLGHSLGEFTAAVAAGVMSFQDALTLVAERSRLIDSLPSGSMLVVRATQSEVEKLILESHSDLDIAAVNSNEQTVVAGEKDEILQFQIVCKSSNVKSVLLPATHAFHSRHMDPMLEEYRKVAESIRCPENLNTCRYISGVLGRVLDNPKFEINADYWVKHTRTTVSFVNACKAVKKMECRHFIEVGPHPVLSTFVTQNLDDVPISCYPSLRRKSPEWETVLTSLGRLYLQGFKVDWEGFDRPYARIRIPSILPFHPFHRKPFWIDCSDMNMISIHPLIGHAFKNPSSVEIFRNKLSVKSLPYLRDHCLGSRIVVPGAAFAEMCLAAGYCVSNSVTDNLVEPSRPMTLEDFTIVAPLAFKDDKQCQVQVVVDLKENTKSNLCSELENTRPDQLGFKVQVFRQNADDNKTLGKWILHASSTFYPSAQTKQVLNNCNPAKAKELITKGRAHSLDGVYKRLENVGLKLGDTFQSIERCWANEGEIGKRQIVFKMKLPKDHGSYLLHPIVIDTALQAIAFTTWWETPANVLKLPVRIAKTVMLSPISKESTCLYMDVFQEENNLSSCYIFKENFTPIAFLTGVEFIETNVKSIESVLEQQIRILPDAWEEVWKPIAGPHENRVELSSVEATLKDEHLNEKLMDFAKHTTADDKDNFMKLERLIYLYTLQAMSQLGWLPFVGEVLSVEQFCEMFSIQSKFSRLVHYYFTMIEKEQGDISISCEKEEENYMWTVRKVQENWTELIQKESESLYEILNKMEKIQAVLNLYKVVGNELSHVLRGKKSILPILFPTQFEPNGKEGGHDGKYSAETYYQEHPGCAEMRPAVLEILGSILHTWKCANLTGGTSAKKKVLKILEVGAGTGLMTADVLPKIMEVWGQHFYYHFTDISASFFARAAVKLGKFQSNLRFCPYDIDDPPLHQGIPLNHFDLIFASNVLHVAKNLKSSLGYLRQCLKPNGVLLCHDELTQVRSSTFVFGLLEGYWQFEDFEWRQNHPCVQAETWRKLLHLSGFEFAHVTEAYLGTMGCITAGASTHLDYNYLDNQRRLMKLSRTWILFSHKDEDFTLQKLSWVLRANCHDVKIVLPSPETETDEAVDSILSGDQTDGIIYAWGMNEDITDQKKISRPFLRIAKFALNQRKPPSLYVLTRGVHTIKENEVGGNPSAATLFGMVKSLKNENSDLSVCYIDLDANRDPCHHDVDDILFEVAMRKDVRERERVQVVYRDGVRYEPRIKHAPIANNPLKEDLQIPACTNRYHLILPETRMIKDLSFDALENEVVGENQAEVIVKAYSLNFKDILTILKPNKEFENMCAVGLDWAGVVTRLGANISPDTLKIGDRVFGAMLKPAQLPSHFIADGDTLLKIPDQMTFVQASAVVTGISTAIHSLTTIARLKAEDVVLIHTGSGGVGLSAIQVAKDVGAKIISTAGSVRKRAYLRSLGIQHVFHSRNTSYQNEIMKVTGGRGVDVVLNTLTGPGFKEATLGVCAPNARFVEVSKLSIWSAEEVRQIRPDVAYSIVDMAAHERETCVSLLSQVQSWVRRDDFTPIPCIQFDALRIRQALHYFQKAIHIGKVVVTMPEVKVEAGYWKAAVQPFNGESTYLITGGLGGIGLEVCKWMLERGATDVVLVGRNPPKPEVAKEIESIGRDKRFKILVKLGDVGNYDQCRAILNEIKLNSKPIRGIHHCAGVLWDNFYASQSWESFETAFNPKVSGTWNLHSLTKDMFLEHFVLYSSMAALVGTPTQANHAAANCFEDAFAHYRHSLGLPALAINWGQWSQVGCAKDINLPGTLPISVKRMLHGLEAAFRDPRIQIGFGEFESLSKWLMTVPNFKYYLDERILKNLTEEEGQSSQFLLKFDKFWQEMDARGSREERLNHLSAYLKIILHDALRMDDAEVIDDNKNLQELGVDSLMSIELKNSIQNLLGSRVTISANMFKDCQTIRDMATVIVDKICEDEQDLESLQTLSPEDLTTLLNNDCVLDESIQSTGKLVETVAVKTVLITGATGQMGPYVLSALCQSDSPKLDRIICLIRAKDNQCAHERLVNVLESMGLSGNVDLTRVEFVAGDVTDTKFGLLDEEYQNLCDSVDAIIHLAAKSDHVEIYRNVAEGVRDIRSVNAVGTLNVLKFASTGATKRVYYSSSLMCVFGGSEDEPLCDDWPEESQIKTIVDHRIMGYPTSKFVSEMLMKAANGRGIPCKVFRFPYMTGHSKTGHLNFVNNHYILRFMSYLKIGAMPSVPVPALVLPVDICVDMSLKMFWNDDAPNQIYNIAHPNPQVEAEFVATAREEFGTSIELVEWSSGTFMEQLCGSEMPMESLKEIYQDADRLQALFTFRGIQGYLKSPETFFYNKKVRQFQDFPKDIPSTSEIIRKNLAYVKSKGYCEKFGL